MSAILSPRELRIVEGVASGLRLTQVTATTGASYSTVRRVLATPAAQAEIQRLRQEAAEELAERLPLLIKEACNVLLDDLRSPLLENRRRAATTVLKIFGAHLLNTAPAPDIANVIEVREGADMET